MSARHFQIVASLAAAQHGVMDANSHLIAIVTSLAAGDAVSRETIRNAISRCDHARQDMDRAIYAALGTLTLNGRVLSAGDLLDMRAALFAALDRIEGKPAPVCTGYPEVGSFVA